MAYVNISDDEKLRKLAEKKHKKLKNKRKTVLSETEILLLMHELEVSQIELEMQNDELKLAKEKAEITADKYTELYDFAPSGYISLSKEGKIIQLNLIASSILGKERMHLINNKLASYISNSTLPTYYSFINSLFSSNIKQICEVIIVLEGKNALYVHISGSLSINENECLLNIIDITENKRIENNLKESEEKYRVLVDNTDTGFVRIDEQGIVISANEPYKKLAGLKVGDYIIGRSILEWIAPDEIENNSNAVRQCALRGFVIDFETIYQHNDGKRLNIKVNASVYKSNEGQNQIVSYCKDITESKQAEEEIFLSRNYLDMIINSVASPIFVKDENHNFTLVNDAFCLLLNLPKENLIGIPSSEYFLNNDFNSFIAKDITIFKTGKEDVSIEILKDSKGKQRSFFTRKTLHTDILGNKFLVGVLNDITELKNTEESLQKETSKLKQTLSFFNNREEQMVKLKKEVNELLIEAGRDKKYMW